MHMEKAQDQQKHYYDKHYILITFNVGGFVVVNLCYRIVRLGVYICMYNIRVIAAQILHLIKTIGNW